MKIDIFTGYRDRNGKEIKEGDYVSILHPQKPEDYSLVTNYQGKLVIFGHYIDRWVFISNRNWNCPYLIVVT